jgi:hypothetical protein
MSSGRLGNRCRSYPEPKVRIHLPPAVSQANSFVRPVSSLWTGIFLNEAIAGRAACSADQFWSAVCAAGPLPASGFDLLPDRVTEGAGLLPPVSYCAFTHVSEPTSLRTAGARPDIDLDR